MQLRFFASIILFLGSYFPLSLILFFQDFRYELLRAPLCWPFSVAANNCAIPLRNPAISITILTVCLLCFIISFGALAFSEPKNPIEIKETKYIPAELMSYTLPYVVSFMSLEYQETGKLMGIAIFLAWMFIITYKSGQLILNPLFIVFGWRLYEIKYNYPGFQQDYTGRALSKETIKPGTRFKHSSIQDIIILESA